MKLLVTGAKGMLGTDTTKALLLAGHEVIALDKDEMDITDEASVTEALETLRPEGVIHLAAYTAVDAAEDDEELCFSVNVKGTEHVAAACEKVGAKLLFISTDYVFDGSGQEPWKEESGALSALNVYGRSKQEAEEAVRRICRRYFILRVSWLFGKNGKNFVRTMLQLGKTRKELSVIGDQVGSPTYTKDLAKLIAAMIVTDRFGVYHATNEGFCSWHTFAETIFTEALAYDEIYKEIRVRKVTSDEYQSRARRPLNSRLSKEKLSENGFDRLPSWQDALRRFLREIREEI